MATENILEAVDRVEETIARFERILYGDSRERTSGLLTEFEGLRRDVQELRQDMHRLQLQRPNFLLWVSGYVSFLLSGAFAMITFYDFPYVRDLLAIPPQVAFFMATLFVLIALVLFSAGFGWINGGGA